MSETVRVTKEQARAAAIAAQGLSPANGATIGSTLESSGFLRTLGGIEVYLILDPVVPAKKWAPSWVIEKLQRTADLAGVGKQM